MAGLGRGQYCSSARDLISYYTNKWLPAITISSISKICINKGGTYSIIFLPSRYSWSFEGALRVEIILYQGIQKLSGRVSYISLFQITPSLQDKILQNAQEAESFLSWISSALVYPHL